MTTSRNHASRNLISHNNTSHNNTSHNNTSGKFSALDVTQWRAEWQLLTRQRLAMWLLGLLLAMNMLALGNGVRVVSAQHELSAARQQVQDASNAAWLSHFGAQQEAGSIGYYYNHIVDQPPPAMAVFALGHRELQPLLLRVRLLGLDGQLYESEQLNPELLMLGGFDFAFVLVYLVPLVLLVLLHDWQSGERESGRLPMLQLLARPLAALWWRRLITRVAPVWLLVLLPALLLAIGRGASLLFLAGLVLIVSVYIAFWVALCTFISRAHWRSSVNAGALLGCWLLLTLVAPSFAAYLIQQQLPVADGMSLTLKHREAVHSAWDKPKADTFARFFQDHPEWRDTPPVSGRFHWKWYYAFQHVGDMQVADDVAQYQARILRREDWSRRTGWLLPSAAVQYALHALADTDQRAQLRWQNAVRAFHDELRTHFYPWLFNDRPYLKTELAQLPRWQAPAVETRLEADVLLAMALITAALGLLARRRLYAPQGTTLHSGAFLSH